MWRRGPATVQALAALASRRVGIVKAGQSARRAASGAFEDRTVLDTRDELLALIRFVTRMMLMHTEPCCKSFGRALSPWPRGRPLGWGWDEAPSAVLAAALDRIAATRSSDRPPSLAANLLGNIWHSVWAQRQIELRHAPAANEPRSFSKSPTLSRTTHEPGAGR